MSSTLLQTVLWDVDKASGGVHVSERVCRQHHTQHKCSPTESQCTVFFIIIYIFLYCTLQFCAVMMIINRSASLLRWPVTRVERVSRTCFFCNNCWCASTAERDLPHPPSNPSLSPAGHTLFNVLRCMRFFHSECTETTCKDEWEREVERDYNMKSK